jgi:hypothetical protein
MGVKLFQGGTGIRDLSLKTMDYASSAVIGTRLIP